MCHLGVFSEGGDLARACANLVVTYIEMLSGSPIDSAVRFRMMSLAEMTAETLS
jgi:hypothetical protein